MTTTEREVRTITPWGGIDDERPLAVVFECADAPVPATQVFDQPPGALVTLRTLGHVIDRGVLASIEFAVHEFDIPLIVVAGHQGCRALRTLTTEFDDLARLGGHLRCAVEQIGLEMSVSAGTDPVAMHVDAVCQRLYQRSPLVAQRVRDGSCAVAGAVSAPDGRMSLHCSIGDVGESAFGLIA